MIIKKTTFYFLISIFIIISLLIGANKLYKYEEIKILKRSDTICALTRLAKIINRNYILKGTYVSLKNLKTDIYNQSNKILCGNDIKKDSSGVLDAFGDRRNPNAILGPLLPMFTPDLAKVPKAENYVTP